MEIDELGSSVQINIPSAKIIGKLNSMSETEDVKRPVSHHHVNREYFGLEKLS